VPPGAVAFGKAVEEDQHRRIARAKVEHVESNAGGEGDPFHPYRVYRADLYGATAAND
jgi:hypothetical protein